MTEDTDKWFYLICVLTFAMLLWLLSSILAPFLLAAIIAYLGDPLVDRLEARGWGRTTSVLLVFLLSFLLVGGALLCLLPILHGQVLGLLSTLPGLASKAFNEYLPPLMRFFNLETSAFGMDEIRQFFMENWRGLSGLVGDVFVNVSSSGKWLMVWLGYLLIVPLVSFYLLRDWDVLIARCIEVLPRRTHEVVRSLGRDCDRVLGEFLRGQLLIMCCLGLMYSFGLWLAGINFSLLIGMFAGLLSFIPWAGGIVGIGIAGVVAFLQFHDIIHLVYVVLVFAIAQGIEGMILTPLLIGSRIGLHPVTVIFAVLTGGQLFGFFGVLLALPVASVLVVVLRHFYQHYRSSSLSY